MLKIIIEFCELAIYKNEDFHPFPDCSKIFTNFSKTMQIFFFIFMHKKRMTFANRTRKSANDISD
jgi:hypothetical protein